MKKSLLFVFLAFVVSPLFCQDNLWINFIHKFETCSLPIFTDTISFKYLNTQNNKNIISLEEFNYFIKDSCETFWKYRTYDQNQKSFFEYDALCKFAIDQDKTGIILTRNYFDDDESKEKGDYLLYIFDSKGNKLSYLPIGGERNDNFVSDIHFDQIAYNSTIYKNYSIEMKTEAYLWKDGKDGKAHISKKYYKIEDGKIINVPSAQCSMQ